MAAPNLRAMRMRHSGLADLLSGDFCCATNGPIVAAPCLLQVAPLEKAAAVSEQAIEHPILHGVVRNTPEDILVDHILGGLVIPVVTTLAILVAVSNATIRTARSSAMFASTLRFNTSVVPQRVVVGACDAILLSVRVANRTRSWCSCLPLVTSARVRLTLDADMPWAIVNHLVVEAIVAIYTNKAQMF